MGKLREKKRWRSALAFLLAMVMAFSGLLANTESVSAGTIVQTTTHYKFITACVFTWGNTQTNRWDPAGPGASFTKNTSTTLNQKAKNIKIYKYDPDLFDMKSTPNIEGRVDPDNYQKDYYKKSVTTLTAQVKGNASSGELNYVWTVNLTAQVSPKDVKKAIEMGQQQEIIDLLGGYIPDNMKDFLKELDEGGKFDDNVQGLLYFVPYIIQYDIDEEIEVPQEEIHVQLGLPVSAKVGESYTVKDESYVPAGSKVKTSKLEKKSGITWKTVTGWNGHSIKELAEGEGTVEYRLTVTLEDGRSGSDSKTITIYDGLEVSGEAVLSLPTVTYEGHSVIAEDYSAFTVNGLEYSATRAYEEKVADNQFSIVESGPTIKRVSKSKIKATATFPSKGVYNVRLRVIPKNGSALVDTKPIEVLKTPTVMAVLNGVQKQNRKQELNVRVATNPKSPLKEVWIELEDLDTGERVRLSHRGDGTANQLKNSETIKTRAIKLIQADEYFTDLCLEFLTKNKSLGQFQYTVYARDSRGIFDEISEAFEVIPDAPPTAKIEMDSSFLRDQGTDQAVVRVKDVSETDGDQLARTWSVVTVPNEEGQFEDSNAIALTTMDGYEDLSFGAQQSVGFRKTGVGRFQVQLHVKDVWNEATLEEYVTEADYLSDSTAKEAEVQNVAPVVTLKALKARQAEILLLAGSEEDEKKLKESVNTMKEVLLQYAVDPNITIQRIAPEISDLETGATQKLTKAFEKEQPMGYNSRWSFLNEDNYLVDETTVFHMEASWKGWDRQFAAEPPYKIRAYDIRTGQQKWVYTITDATAFSQLAQDDGGKYLFCIRGAETLVIDKATGSRLTTLGMVLGDDTIATDRYLYTFKPNGIHRISLSDGSAEHVYKGGVKGPAKRVHGVMHFFTQDNTTLSRGIFDPATEKVSYQHLKIGEGDSPAASYTATHIDAAGGMVIRGISANAARSDLVTYFIDGQNNHKSRLFFHNVLAYENIVTPVLDEGGVTTHLLHTTKTGSSARGYATHVDLYDFDQNLIDSSHKNDHGPPSHPEYVLFARQFGNYVYACTGAYWDWIYGETYSNGPRHGLPQRTTITRFDLSRKKGEVVALTTGADITNTEEYSKGSDTAVVVKCTDNNQYGGNDRITTLVWEQNADAVLTRYINKHFTKDSETKVLAVLDSSNRAGKSSVSEAVKLLDRYNVEFYYGTDLSYSDTYGIQLAQQSNGMVIGETSQFARQVAEAMLAEKTEGSHSLLMETTKADTGLSRSFVIEPGTRYYFEYDVKSEEKDVQNLLRLKPAIQKTVQTGLMAERYVVTDGFFEDFSDSHTNPYFNLRPDRVMEGKYYGANLKEDVGKGAYPYKDTGVVSFNVPKDKKAILTFDYDAAVYPSNIWEGSTIDIGTGELTGKTVNGQKEVKVQQSERWRAFLNNSGKGYYTHHSFLPEGLNTISMNAWTVGQNKLYAHTALDNLQVVFLEKDDGSFPEDIQLQSVTEQSLGNGWKRVSGYFQSPHRTVAYQRQNATYYKGPFKDSPHGNVTQDPKDNRDKTATLTFPANRTAVYLGIDTRSTSKSKKRTRFTWENYTWTNLISASFDKRTPETIPDKYRLQLHNVTGTQKINMKADWNGGNGYFDSYETILVNSPNECTKTHRYFFDEGKLFIENERYTGTAEIQMFPRQPGKYQLNSLRLFTVENGNKVYIANERFDSAEAVNRWKAADGTKTAIIRDDLGIDDPGNSLIYRKGELVAYGISYYDYETDPSKRSYWKYTHKPFNDGEHPDAAAIVNDGGEVVKLTGKVLDKPIDRFYIDGKYIVEHWQEDDTSRGQKSGGNSDYDKLSNVETITFYIQGSGEAPWITSIETSPKEVKEGKSFAVKIGVDDKEKDLLSLLTEVYLDGKLVHTHLKTGIQADATGRYPIITTDAATPSAKVGKYEIVCTVKDDTGTGIDSMQFTVVSEGKVTGWVYHTEQWDKNRKKYNIARFADEINFPVSFGSYVKEAAPRKRGTNVFWSGETFVLEAALAGNPSQVTAQIQNHSDYKTTLYNTGKKTAAGETIYAGTLWKNSMINKWGQTVPEQLTFRFTARYPGEVEKIHDATVIVDSQTDYWLLHRLW